MYHRCAKCRQISGGKKCQYCKIKVANAIKLWHHNSVININKGFNYDYPSTWPI